MDTQRELDAMTFAQQSEARERMMDMLLITEEFVSFDKSRADALSLSQAAFEAYCDSHLRLLSVMNDGTDTPTLRNAELEMLFQQRIEFLRAFAVDHAPDSSGIL